MTGKRRKRLRSGFTTGTAAAAAAKAALLLIFSGRAPRKVGVELLTGDTMKIKVHACRHLAPDEAVCSVIKDGGDDPDITHGAEIGARVRWEASVKGRTVTISGGQGVGRVTRPGLETPPGRPAINSGPRKMIRRAALQAMADHGLYGAVEAEIFVPEGEALARHTLNARLGIVGGISILGTTGIVRPLSHEAYVATVQAALSVARASGLSRVVLTTGRRSERFARQRWPHIPDEGFVQIGDYFAQAMQMAADLKFEQVMLAVFFGKAVKMAQGIAHTHARSARLTLEKLARWALEVTGSADLAECVAGANTARHVFDLIKDDYPALIAKVGREVVRSAATFARGKVGVGAVIFGFDGSVVSVFGIR
ncbi:MAG: cobalt-precorrin-5B (C(1))-methyltransferase CbiD [Desulfobacteraceae bacterium]|jgi:cobalt-precorrin-5B (C1)-methyltransferase